MTLDQALERINAARGSGYRLLGSFDGGEVGASDVVDAAGRRAVAKWEWPADHAAVSRRSRAAQIIRALRARGARIPEYLTVESIDGGQLVLQEFMPGTSGDRVSEALIAELVSFNELQAGLVPDGSGWTDYVRRSLIDGLDGYCEHASLEQHSASTRALLQQIRSAGAALDDMALEERDAVHLDFHHRNVLVADGRLSAVIDCDGYRSGDRAFDLVTLAFCLHAADRPAEAEADLWRVVKRLRGRAVICAYVAHQALRQVDWSIRCRTARDVEPWLMRSATLLTSLTA